MYSHLDEDEKLCLQTNPLFGSIHKKLNIQPLKLQWKSIILWKLYWRYQLLVEQEIISYESDVKVSHFFFKGNKIFR